MKLDEIKDVVITRWKFIASNAESIAKTARAMEEAEMLGAVALKQIRVYQDDNEEIIKSLELLLKALDIDEWDGDEE